MLRHCRISWRMLYLYQQEESWELLVGREGCPLCQWEECSAWHASWISTRRGLQQDTVSLTVTLPPHGVWSSTMTLLSVFKHSPLVSTTHPPPHTGVGGLDHSLNWLLLQILIFLSLHILRPSPLYSHTHRLSQYCELLGDLCSDDRGVPVLQQLSHYCPRLRELILPRLRPPYLSLVPQLPQHTLDTLTLRLPLMKDDSVLGHHLQLCLALKHLTLWDQRTS